MKFVVLLARLFIGGVFIYASVHKILDPAAFAASVRNYMLIPAAWSNIVAMALPWIEFGTGVFLVLGLQTRPSALLTTGMLAVFLAAIIRAHAIGLDINCGCFSSSTDPAEAVGLYHIVRDALILTVSAAILAFDRGGFSITSVSVFRGRPTVLNT